MKIKYLKQQDKLEIEFECDLKKFISILTGSTLLELIKYFIM